MNSFQYLICVVRCEWGELTSQGVGPFHKFNQRRAFAASFLENWEKFFISLDEDGLHLYDSKQSSQSIFSFPMKDLKGVKVAPGNPTTRTSIGLGGNTTIEDHYNVIVYTKLQDEIFLR